MELVYLWVDSYKNIEKQGFNFSPKFNCHYDGETLTINENIDKDGNKKYIENFFGDNINVTAIVGKNGSGKSSVLFQEDGGGTQEWTKGFKIILKNNILELLEPFDTFWDDNRDPYVRVFNIINHTKYQYNKMSIYKSINLNDLNKQYVLGEAENKKLDDEYSIYYDGDILRYLDTDKLNYHMFGTYGFSHINPNSLTFFINENPNFEEDETLIDFQYAINTDILERKIKHIINNTQYKLLKFLDFKIELNDNNFLFSLSHGQRSMTIFLALLLDKIDELDKDLIIYLDEPDIALHPKWQKKLIDILVEILSQNKNIKIHFIVTTHSPFLLSDIPKQNIIFLDTYKKDEDDNQKEGNCKVVDGTKQTFGANIHTLLTDSFFMEGGLMGEFAKQKINEIIKNLKDKKYKYTKKEKTKVLLTIESIGEPFLKSKLLDMYNRRFIDDYKIREQKRIDEQIRILQEKREQLK